MDGFAERPLPAADAEQLREVARRLDGRVELDAPLGERSTYRVGGRAALATEPGDVDDLEAVAEALTGTEVPILVLGRGSNLLVADAGFGGLVVTLDERWAGVEIEGTEVRAGGAAALPVVARRTASEGLTGFEWAVGVPGSVGGAVRMNAGGHGSDMRATLVRVRLFGLRSGEDGEVPATALDLAYRSSSVGADEIVLRADLALARGDRARSEAEVAEIVRWRRERQPGGTNAGSVFTNPIGDSAGRLIEEAGAKALRFGSAVVSDKHANFIQADEGGSADDVWALMSQVRSRVQDVTGIELEPETRLVGFPGTLGGPA